MKSNKWTKYKEQAGLFYVAEMTAFLLLLISGFRLLEQSFNVQVAFWAIHVGATVALLIGLVLEHLEWERQLDNEMKDTK